MADAFTGEIRIFAGNFPPKDWAFCNGQLMSIQQNTALFSILGTQYGGDGKTTFALPNLMGAAPIGQGIGPGLTGRSIGAKVGTETVTLLESEMPAHSHTPQAIPNPGTSGDPNGRIWSETVATGRPAQQHPLYNSEVSAVMSPQALGAVGGSLPHNNMQPFLAVNYIICLYGEYPSRG
ncbi:tail fiber protein [Lysinibacillus telephonicus]|uniref:Phage tail protein n=1 Tax=Lysinibacillus telephonicus TaxID=1714840 RepID=A0A3S0HHR2_9BACI|nr:tail fiber protein [Lysinibacillus telephonicus]RTQ90566.1 phage tail protein [Lysinibacillus telephonicus]